MKIILTVALAATLVFVNSCGRESGNSFADFISVVNNLDIPERQEAVNKYLEDKNNSPIIEKDSTVIFFYKGEYSDDISLVTDWGSFTNPDKMVNVVGTDFAYYKKTVSPKSRIEYAFMAGDSTFPDPKNEKNIWRWGSVFSEVKLPEFEPSLVINNISEKLKGELHAHSIQSSYLKNIRKFMVYTPEGYDESRDYQTIFTQDGSLYINRLKLPNVLDYMIANGLTEETIAVFVDPIERGAEYRDIKTELYKKFFIYELIPFIENNYSISNGKQNRSLIGFSRGGLISLNIALSYPDEFGTVIAQSPALPPTDIINDFRNSERKDVKLIITCGSHEFRWVEDVRDLADVLKTKGYDLIYYEVPEGHSVFTWRRQFENILPSVLK